MVCLKMNRHMRLLNIFLFLLTLVFFSCANLPPVKYTKESPEKTGEPVIPPAAGSGITGSLPGPEHPEEDFLTIVAAGDNLFHAVMIKDGEEGDYKSIYQEIRALVEPADIAFINQETLLAGEDFGFSGYPKFNTPRNVGQAITEAGFTVINHATNHVMDRDERAILATIGFWDEIPQVTVLGIHRSEEQRNLPVLVKKNNITVGFLSYTYGTNGIPVPSDKPFLTSLIDTEIMGKEIDALRPLCDFLVVSMHWGKEYQTDYDKKQEDLVTFLAEHRVDLVIGHHPHVIQPIQYIVRPDGGNMLCFYSLGNLISAQTQNPTLLGALAYIRIKKIPATGYETAKIVFSGIGAIPIVTHFEKNFTGFKVYPLFAYTDELLAKHWKNQAKKELTMDYLTGLAAATLGDREIRQNPFN